ncbi:hypothetical protein EI171_26000 [Bradyrhizobium sp. LCT2]|uniref:hypothetical protein n=1 Tax=Bradyrhizobium sp. LCT2 TaxID=2493093 RepID=UPI001373FACF|nr:hypothetical protein [Bradyrhizobium sp. LCT2]QHP70440.1 hypothetical protein EI171_26000 [Bradyrhizobium sp. LCT2]
MALAGFVGGTASATFANVFAFGPLLLTERGCPAEIAASHVSIALWVTIAAIPVGGALGGYHRVSTRAAPCWTYLVAKYANTWLKRF